MSINLIRSDYVVRTTFLLIQEDTGNMKGIFV